MNELTNVENKFVNYIDHVMQSNKLSHSYLIEMEDSFDEFPLILMFVKMILCPKHLDNHKNIDCGQCNICHLIDQNNYSDLQIIETEGTQIKKQQLLDLKEEFSNYSLNGQRRVYIIKEAEKLNPSSANTILKFLEEPEDGIVAILLTKNRYQVLDTILSRCQIFSLKRFHDIEVDDNTVQFLKLLKNPDELFIQYKFLYENIFPDKLKAKEFFLQLEEFFTHYLYLSSIDKENKKFSFLDSFDKLKILMYLTIIEEELPKLVYNINYKLWLNSFFARFVEVK